MKLESSSMELMALEPSIVKISYVEVTRYEDSTDQSNSHVHPECEIYFNISGNVSFMVENRIYPITPGDIIITRPYEYHHCIYHSDELHRHYCVFFTPHGSREFLSRFFDRRPGENNLLSISKSERADLLKALETLRGGNVSQCEIYSNFFHLLGIIESAKDASVTEHAYPAEIDTILDYIEKKHTENLSVGELADISGMSVNTLERHFRKSVGMSPLTYLKKKRLANAARLLSEGSTVLDACISSGFSDYSHFIMLFKSAYGVTPLKYKKKSSHTQ